MENQPQTTATEAAKAYLETHRVIVSPTSEGQGWRPVPGGERVPAEWARTESLARLGRAPLHFMVES